MGGIATRSGRLAIIGIMALMAFMPPGPARANDPPQADRPDPSTIRGPAKEPATALLAGEGSLETQSLAEGVTAEQMVEEIFGGRLEVSNVQYSGAPVAAGIFSGGSGILGLDRGVVLSNGDIGNALGPNISEEISTANQTPGDADLNALIPGYTTNDAAILEFDFIPTAERLRFDYVMASDEYNEWANSDFNDVFGLFIDGVNQALLPIEGSEIIPVSINNVNGGNPLGTNAQHPEFYINNDLASGAPLNTEMDGMTRALSVVADVVPGQVTHAKLAIADASDFALDSNVFIVALTECAGEDLEAGLVGPGDGQPGITVKYDPKSIADRFKPGYVEDAAQIADAVRDRAVKALGHFSDLEFTVPPSVTIEIRCQLVVKATPLEVPFGLVDPDAGGYTGNSDDVQLRSSFIREQFAQIDDFEGLDWNTPSTPWASLVDHEMFHTVQQFSPTNMGWNYIFGGDTLNLESGAVLAQDLIKDADDDGDDVDVSYWREVQEYFSNPGPLQLEMMTASQAYEGAAMLQYLGERYGGGGGTREQQVARFLNRLLTGRTQIDGLRDAINDDAVDPFRALLDFVVTAYVHAPDKYPDQWAIQDERAGYGGTGPAPRYPNLPVAQAADVPADGTASIGAELGWLQGRVFRFDLPANTPAVVATLDGPSGSAGARMAVLPILDDGSIQVSPRAQPANRIYPELDRGTFVPTGGVDSVAVVVAPSQPGFHTVRVRGADCFNPAIDIVDPTQGAPDAVGSGSADPPIQLEVFPNCNGVKIPTASADAFQVWIGGEPATVTQAQTSILTSNYWLTVKAGPNTPSGVQDVRVRFLDLTEFTEPGALVVDGAAPLLQSVTVGSLAAFLHVDSEVQASSPLVVSLAIADAAGAVLDASVTATVTGPDGSVTLPLADDGGHGDGLASDGVYAARAWPREPGVYHVEIAASGTDNGAMEFSVTDAADVTVVTATDVDADGVTDSVEAPYGLSPSDPADGALDFDGDGLTNAQELHLGLNPLAWDSDGSGEGDASEVAAGRNALDPADDGAPPRPQLSAFALDDFTVGLVSQVADETASIRLIRQDGDTSTVLATVPAALNQYNDVPGVAGTFTYRAIAVGADGAESAPVDVGPITTVADAVPPTFNLTANDGAWETATTTVAVHVSDLSETVSEMRMAESEGELAAATWLPFAEDSTFELDPELGTHLLYMQVRDAAGKVSATQSAVLELVDATAPVSSAGSLEPQYETSPIEVPFTASDDLSAVDEVELWWRYRADEEAAWSEWALGPVGDTSPLTFAFDSGEGIYEFHTIAIDGTGNREEPPAEADSGTVFIAATVIESVTRTFSFTSGLEGWIGSGTNCTSQHSSTDGAPAGSLSTTVAGKNRTANCIWRSPVATTWEDWGVPSGARILTVRLESAAGRVAVCTSCLAGQLNGYRLESSTGVSLATLWSGRSLPAGQESWQTVAAQGDREVPASSQGSGSQVRVALDATLKTGSPGSSTVTLRQDEIALVITYELSQVEQPDFTVSLHAKGPHCPAGMECPHGTQSLGPASASVEPLPSGSFQTVNLTGSGSAWATGDSVSVEWRLFGVRTDGTVVAIKSFALATPTDGAFDEPDETFEIADTRFDSGYTHYDVEVRVTAGDLSTSRIKRVLIDRCDPLIC